jgi:hypothetical protein
LSGWAAQAEEPPPSLPVAEAEGYLGDWELDVDIQGQTIKFAMSVLDEGGFVAAKVIGPQGEQRITEIKRSESGLDMAFEAPFGRVHLDLELDQGALSGRLYTETGGFEAKLTGKPGEIDLERLARATGGLFGRPPPEARLEVEGGRIRVRYPRQETAEATLRREGTGTAELLVMPESAALKLRTDVSLAFGETVVKAGNIAEGYPGVYSLWLKRDGENWSLVFNREADVWGTQHDPQFDVAEVPLDVKSTLTPGAPLTVSLEKTAEGGLLRATWNDREWTAAFRIAQ